MTSLTKFSFLVITVVALSSCNDDFNWIGKHTTPRVEYAPNMYRSEAYEPLSQVTDSTDMNEYNSNPYNPYRMNMRVPATGTVKRNVVGNWPFWKDSLRPDFLPMAIGPQGLDSAAAALQSPYSPDDESVLKDGETLYTKFCSHCHGQTGQGDGEVGKRLGGVPRYNEPRLKNVSGGHIFHVITYGKGRMGAHASLLNPDERWKIVRYVQNLQKQ